MTSTATAVLSGAALKTAQATAVIASASSDPVRPGWLDPGHAAWQMTAATLIALQSIPGFVILYAGWVSYKWSINSAFIIFTLLPPFLFAGFYKFIQMLPLVGSYLDRMNFLLWMIFIPL